MVKLTPFFCRMLFMQILFVYICFVFYIYMYKDDINLEMPVTLNSYLIINHKFVNHCVTP